MSQDLTADSLRVALPGRAVRSYRALLSTEADALAWARAGATAGSVVAADYQASPRGRGGLPWRIEPGRDLAFSMVLRPELPAAREGWLYVLASAALRTGLPHSAGRLHWPDSVHDAQGIRRAAVGVHCELGPGRVDWAVLSVLVHRVAQPRDDLLATLVRAVEQAFEAPVERILERYRAGCATLGSCVKARLVPLGPAGVEIAGEAVDVNDDGALVLLTEQGHRVAVRPQHLARLEPVG